MKVSEIGEFGLIDLLNKMITEAKLNEASPDLILGVGDDAAAWKGAGQVQLATVDTMVQDIHFTLETVGWEELGWKSLAINISDIAAMGGIPRYALIALALPDDTESENITALYRGMIEIAKKYKMAIVGGNISKAPQASITVTVLGSSPDNKLLRRATARVGDTIAITGYTGNAAAGLEMLKKKLKFKAADAKYLRNAFLRPVPRVEEGQLLIKNGISTAIDTSDGLYADLLHICEMSKVNAIIYIDRLPVNDVVKTNFSEYATELALGGGEDYELIFTGSTEAIEKVKVEAKCPVTIIGEITGGEPAHVDLFNPSGKHMKIKRWGWTHF